MEVSKELLSSIKKVVGDENVSLSKLDLISYSRDIWPREMIRVWHKELGEKPLLVVWPSNVEELVSIVQLSRKFQTPIIPMGGASGVCGGTIPKENEIIVDLKRLNNIREIDRESMLVEVEAGINGEIFERKLNQEGLTLGHFPSSIYCSTVGGWLATRSAGQLSSKYGKIEDMVRGLEVVLADGKVLRTDISSGYSSGPELNSVFVGSEGTLGIISASILKVWRYPSSRRFQAFMFEGVEPALEAIREMLQSGLRPACIRLYDPVDTFFSSTSSLRSSEHKSDRPKKKSILSNRNFVRTARTLIPYVFYPELYNRILERQAKKCKLVLTFEGEPEFSLFELEASKKICLGFNGIDLGEEPAKHWWKNRYKVSYTMSKGFDLGMFIDTIEVATLWDNLLPLYYGMQSAIRKHALVMAHFSHAYPEGCSIYFSIASTGRDLKSALSRYDKIWESAMEACMKYEGALSHHHGVGMLKAKWMEKEAGGANPVLAGLKKVLDPDGYLNPGKLGL